MRFIKLHFIILLLFSSLIYGQNVAITYNLGGRFGDCLLSYLHAKWLSYQYNLPLLYQPFKYSNELVLHDYEICFDNKFAFKKRIKVLNIKSIENVLKKSKNSTLFIVPYFPEKNFGRSKVNELPYFETNWKDKQFRSLITQLIVPKKEIQTVEVQKNCINIAVHVREGGGFDKSNIQLELPTKLPPISFYKEGLSRIIELFPGRALYFYIFTDSQNPEEIAIQLQEFVGKNDLIKFDWRKENNFHDTNVLEDFFSLFKFDVLIRPQSNFSFIPTLMHDFAVVFSPQSASVVNQRIVIDKCDLVINEVQFNNLLKDK